MKRRTLLSSIFLTPLAAIIGKLKSEHKVWTNSRKEIINCIEFNGTSDWVHVAETVDGKGNCRIYVNGKGADAIGYSKCLNAKEIKQIYEKGKSKLIVSSGGLKQCGQIFFIG